MFVVLNQNQDIEHLDDLIEQEKHEKEKSREIHLLESLNERKEKLKSKEALIDDLVTCVHVLLEHSR